ncbi:MAG: hypothetical protein HYX41_07955 [Bdellovibrio sp.]|nr:hypothetical protein [Bdellovibrio sp.]
MILKRSNRERISKGLLSLVLLVLCFACSPPNPGQACGWSKDQWGTFMPPMDYKNTVKVRVDSRFTDAELEKVQGAIKTWNEWSTPEFKRDFYEVEVTDITSGEEPNSISDCGFIGSSTGQFSIIRETSADRWKSMDLTSANPGVTVRCRAGEKLSKQVVIINPNYVNASQLQSVLLHELGHSTGLDHSCLQNGGRDDFAGCLKLADDHPYKKAVMYPVLSVFVNSQNGTSGPQIKEALQENDEGRAKCLYSVAPDLYD